MTFVCESSIPGCLIRLLRLPRHLAAGLDELVHRVLDRDHLFVLRLDFTFLSNAGVDGGLIAQAGPHRFALRLHFVVEPRLDREDRDDQKGGGNRRQRHDHRCVDAFLLCHVVPRQTLFVARDYMFVNANASGSLGSWVGRRLAPDMFTTIPATNTPPISRSVPTSISIGLNAPY